MKCGICDRDLTGGGAICLCGECFAFLHKRAKGWDFAIILTSIKRAEGLANKPTLSAEDKAFLSRWEKGKSMLYDLVYPDPYCPGAFIQHIASKVSRCQK